MSDADCTPGHEPRSVAASHFMVSVIFVVPQRYEVYSYGHLKVVLRPTWHTWHACDLEPQVIL